MGIIKPVNGIMPQIGQNCFIADGAIVVGDVVMGDRCSIWFNAVIRGDVNSIRIGDECNIQDGAVIHTTYKVSKAILGNRVSIGHNTLIHGCTIEDGALIGMGAIIMDHATVGEGALVAAGAVVLGGTTIEPGTMWAGVPAKKRGILNEEQLDMVRRTPSNYMLYSSWFMN